MWCTRCLSGSFTGVARLGHDVPEDVKQAFDYQRELNIPRALMGKSIVELGKAARYACNGDDLGMLEIDMSVAFVQLRLGDANGAVDMPACRELVAASPSTSAFLERLSTGQLDLCKKALKAMTNQSSEKGLALDRLPASCVNFLRAVKS